MIHAVKFFMLSYEKNPGHFSSTIYVSLQTRNLAGLQMSSTMLTEEVVKIRQACVGLPTPFLQIVVALTLPPGTTIV